MGTALALPLLDSMIPAMAGDAAHGREARGPARLRVRSQRDHSRRPGCRRQTGTDFEFMPTMKPLEPFRDKLLVLSNLAQSDGRALGDGAGDHARAGATWLTGVHPKKTEGVGYSRRHFGRSDRGQGIRQDHAVGVARNRPGRALSRGRLRFRLQLRLHQHHFLAQSDHAESDGDQSARGVRAAVRRRRQHRSGGAHEAHAAKTAASSISSASDVARLQPGLGARDKSKLDEYLEAIRDIERRIQKAEEQSATMKLPVMERPRRHSG